MTPPCPPGSQSREGGNTATDSFLSAASSGLGVFPEGRSPNPALESQEGQKGVSQTGEEGSGPGRGEQMGCASLGQSRTWSGLGQRRGWSRQQGPGGQGHECVWRRRDCPLRALGSLEGPSAGLPSDGACYLLPGTEHLTQAPCRGHWPEHPGRALCVGASCPRHGRAPGAAFHLLLILLHVFERWKFSLSSSLGIHISYGH